MLPVRSFDTMSEAIALSSPSGSMSKRARDAAQKRFSAALFGPGGLQRPGLPEQPSEAEYLRRKAADLRDLAARGVKPRAYMKKALELEAQAAAL